MPIYIILMRCMPTSLCCNVINCYDRRVGPAGCSSRAGKLRPLSVRHGLAKNISSPLLVVKLTGIRVSLSVSIKEN